MSGCPIIVIDSLVAGFSFSFLLLHCVHTPKIKITPFSSGSAVAKAKFDMGHVGVVAACGQFISKQIFAKFLRIIAKYAADSTKIWKKTKSNTLYWQGIIFADIWIDTGISIQSKYRSRVRVWHWRQTLSPTSLSTCYHSTDASFREPRNRVLPYWEHGKSPTQ